jgi:hypothetical protein
MAVVKEIRTNLLGMRLANIYSLSAKCFVFKFASPGVKKFLLMESGIRLHTTQYAREKDEMPNNFAAKLRKHIRTKRLEMVRQLGLDRIIILTFGSGDSACHVVLELFASGNIILTDHEYSIMNVLRVFTYENADGQLGESKDSNVRNDEKAVQRSGHQHDAKDDGGRRVAVGQIYPMDIFTATPERITVEELSEVVQGQLATEVAARQSEEEKAKQHEKEKESVAAPVLEPADAADLASKGGKGDGKKKKKASAPVDPAPKKKEKAMTCKALFGSKICLGPLLMEHALMLADLDPSAPATSLSASQLTGLAAACAQTLLFLQRVASDPMPGLVIVRVKKASDDAPGPAKASSAEAKGDAQAAELVSDNTKRAALEGKDVELYSEYLPALLAHNQPHTTGPYNAAQCSVREFADLCTAMDEFYSRQEIQKQEVNLLKERQAALHKVERVRTHHQVDGCINAEADMHAYVPSTGSAGRSAGQGRRCAIQSGAHRNQLACSGRGPARGEHRARARARLEGNRARAERSQNARQSGGSDDP